MNILKVNLVILHLCIVKSECGLIDAVLGTVRNTTNALRADIHNAVAYGNDLVFGGPKDIQSDPNATKGPEEPQSEGLITSLYHKSVDKIHDVREKLHNVFVHDHDNTDQPHKGLITKMVDSVNNNLKNVQEYFESTTHPPSILVNPVVNSDENFLGKDPAVVRDEILNLYRNNTEMLNKLNISESDLFNIFKDLNVTVKDQLVLPTTGVKDDVALDIDIRTGV